MTFLTLAIIAGLASPIILRVTGEKVCYNSCDSGVRSTSTYCRPSSYRVMYAQHGGWHHISGGLGQLEYLLQKDGTMIFRSTNPDDDAVTSSSFNPKGSDCMY